VSTLWDLSARNVVGWAMRSRLETMLVEDTWRMALGRRQPAAGLRHHADRGSQDASHGYQDMLATHGIVCSMSRQGACLDNVVAERFFGSLKREWPAHRYDATRQEARDDMSAYIEMCYTSRRTHSYLGYVSPNEDEKWARVA
jgi:putative transposase